MFAWTGAALFVASLAYFLYAYLIQFGRPAEATPGSAIAWNVVLFSGFALHHSVFARLGARAALTRLLGAGRERSVYVWVASLLFIAVCAGWRPVAGVAWDVSGPARGGLWALQLAGVWLTLHSAALIDVWDLAGLRPTAAAGTTAGAVTFRVAGPYAWVRHPIYSGWCLIVFAAAPMTGTRLLFAVVSSAYLLLAIPFEERTLRATSAGAYDRYSRQVRWKLVPGVY